MHPTCVSSFLSPKNPHVGAITRKGSNEDPQRQGNGGLQQAAMSGFEPRSQHHILRPRLNHISVPLKVYFSGEAPHDTMSPHSVPLQSVCPALYSCTQLTTPGSHSCAPTLSSDATQPCLLLYLVLYFCTQPQALKYLHHHLCSCSQCCTPSSDPVYPNLFL